MSTFSTEPKHTPKVIALAIVALCAAVVIGLLLAITPTFAADLGGDCCADLEDRIAELEATAALKGNRKVSLEVTGQINEAYTYVSLDGFHDGRIGDNGNDGSFVRFDGGAKITPDLSAGFVLEINIEELGLLNSGISSSEPLTRQSFFWVKSDKWGKLSVGDQAQATNFFNNPDGYSTNTAWLAGKPLSLGSLSNLYLTGIDLPFDGSYQNAVKYTSPVLFDFFTVSTSWASSTDALSSSGEGNTYDVAVRYDSKESLKDFDVKAAAGFRHSTDFPLNIVNLLSIDLPTGDVNTVLVTGSVLHTPTGIFVNGEFANQDWATAKFTLRGYDVTAGVREPWLPVGKTELFGTWGRFEFDPTGGSTTDLDYYGLGATQEISAAATTLYVGWRHYNADALLNTDVEAVNGGAVIKF